MAELRINTTGKLSLFDADDSHAASIVAGTVTANENVMSLATAGVTFNVPTITLGDATAEDTKLVFDGNAQDFYIGLDDSADDLLIGLGSTVGTTPIISLDENKLSTFSGAITVGVNDTGHDVKLFGATSGSYALWDESADDLNLIASGLGIGTAKDLGVGIHIRTADSSGSANSGCDELVIENNGPAGIQINSANDSIGLICFGDDGANNRGYIQYNHDGDLLSIGTAASTAWHITSGGDLLPGATDHGIHLGVTTAGDANLLSDYEEGSWTPSNSDVTLGVTDAHYTKIGNVVTIAGYVTWPSNSDGSAAQVEGLPFTVKSGNHFGYLTGRAGGIDNQVVVQCNAGTTEADLYQENDTGLSNADLSGAYFTFSGLYFV